MTTATETKENMEEKDKDEALTLSDLQHGKAHVVAELHHRKLHQSVADVRAQHVTPGTTHREGDVHRLPHQLLLLASSGGCGDVDNLKDTTNKH